MLYLEAELQDLNRDLTLGLTDSQQRYLACAQERTDCRSQYSCPVCFGFHYYLVLFIFIYLKDRNRWTDLPSPKYSPTAGARPGPSQSKKFQVFWVRGGGPSSLGTFCGSLEGLSRKRHWQESSWDSNQHRVRCWCHSQKLTLKS